MSAAEAPPVPLHSLQISRYEIIFNRVFAAIYGGAILILMYDRVVFFLNSTASSFFISISLLLSDFILAFMWISAQSFRIRPIRRREFPENVKLILKESEYPAVDIFVCTADPYREPPMRVVNTVLSVMAYDYPAEKISVYVSDDGGSDFTLFALMEASKFAGLWLPFCRRNDVVDPNPDVFFNSNRFWNPEMDEIKEMYESMKMKVDNVMKEGKVGDEYLNGEHKRLIFNQWFDSSFTPQHHSTFIQILLESCKDRDINGQLLPNLIYVSRQKNKTSPHHFKAGALNVLLRVSAVMTNAPIILTLDCDMYSNDPQTLNRALCYLLDTKLRSKLGYIQFPQCFHGINKNDIYACELKRIVKLNPIGMDGLSGPSYTGTNCFFVRRVFFGNPSSLEALELPELSPNHVVEKLIQSQNVLDLAHHVASYDYENNTKWGIKLGFRYGSLIEDYYTGYQLQCEGWNSIFCNPNRAAFYGDAPISLLDTLIQNKRWAIGSLEVGFSKESPIRFGVRSMGLIMGLSYTHYAFWPIWSIPAIFYAFFSPLAVISTFPIFPKPSEPWFPVYLFLFMAAYGKDLLDFIVAGSTFRRWWNEQRMWMIRSVTSYFFAAVEFILKSSGVLTHGNFNVTSKVLEDEQIERYEQQIFEFGASSIMFVPVAMAAAINFAAFTSRLIGILRGGDWEDLFGETFLAGFICVNCWPVYEAMVLRRDRGKMPTKISIISMLLCFMLFSAISLWKNY